MVQQKHVLGARGYKHHWRKVAHQPVAAEAEGGRTTEQRWDDCKLNSPSPFLLPNDHVRPPSGGQSRVRRKNLCSRLCPMRSGSISLAGLILTRLVKYHRTHATYRPDCALLSFPTVNLKHEIPSLRIAHQQNLPRVRSSHLPRQYFFVFRPDSRTTVWLVGS